MSRRQRYHLRLAGGAAAWVAAATLDAVAAVNLRKPPRKSRCRAFVMQSDGEDVQVKS